MDTRKCLWPQKLESFFRYLQYCWVYKKIGSPALFEAINPHGFFHDPKPTNGAKFLSNFEKFHLAGNQPLEHHNSRPSPYLQVKVNISWDLWILRTQIRERSEISRPDFGGVIFCWVSNTVLICIELWWANTKDCQQNSLSSEIAEKTSAIGWVFGKHHFVNGLLHAWRSNFSCTTTWKGP